MEELVVQVYLKYSGQGFAYQIEGCYLRIVLSKNLTISLPS